MTIPCGSATATSLSFVTVFLLLCLHLTEAEVGVAYGRDGDNLPSPQDVVNLYKSNGIKSMRLYYPDHATLQALQGTDIKLMLDVPNDILQSIASCACNAHDWVRANVIPYQSTITHVVVGNEIHPSDQRASSVLPAMQNIHFALNNNIARNTLSSNSDGDINGDSEIKVSTAIKTDLIINSYPPSNAEFSNLSYITPIIDFINKHDSNLLVNVYTYYAYANDPQQISLDYALFRSPGPVFTDPNNGLKYQNLFDAILDSIYASLWKAGARRHHRHIVSESGWPSRGGFGASPANAGAYYRNLANHVKQGTPLTPGQPIEVYMFAMFDENKKRGDATEAWFGIFDKDKQPKYGPINFS